MSKDTQNKCREALAYTLRRIRDEPRIAWYFMDTESHPLMLEALAQLEDRELDFLDKVFTPEKTEDPYVAGRDAAISDATESGEFDHLHAAAIVDEPDPVIIDVRLNASLEDIFFTLNKFPGHNRITLIPR